MDGIVLIDKPGGWSSFDVIRKLRHQLADGGKPPKMGHAGTLDPMATGLLIVLVGKATKSQDRFMKLDKTYEAKITLGENSSTDDSEGELTRVSQYRPSQEEVATVSGSFTGEISQVPPQFSAIKVDGKRAYKTAREGGHTELKSRQVTIHSIDLISYQYPVIHINCHVSSGTYIRSLARDIGSSLSTGAYLSYLRRTSIGDWSVEDATIPEDVGPDSVIAY